MKPRTEHIADLPVGERGYSRGCRCTGCTARHAEADRRVGLGPRFGEDVQQPRAGAVRALPTDTWPGRP